MYGPQELHGKGVLRDTVLRLGRERKIRSNRKTMYHRSRNGVYDPVTYYHLLDRLLDVRPGTIFRSVEFARELNYRIPDISWDPVTVGRIITDIAETLSEANGYIAIGANRRFDGMIFDVSGHPDARAAMENLLDDLEKVALKELEDERDNKPMPKRLRSPLSFCPSVMSPSAESI